MSGPSQRMPFIERLALVTTGCGVAVLAGIILVAGLVVLVIVALLLL